MSNNLFKIPSAATIAKPGTPSKPAYCELKAVKETTGSYPIYQILDMIVIDRPTIDDPNKPITGIVIRKLIGYSPGVTTVKYVRTCYPAVAGIPGIPGAPATQNPGWNGGARTIAFITGNGAFRFHVAPAVVGAMVGIGASPDPAYAFNEITHGFYTSRGSYTIMESGNPVFGPAPNVNGQEFAVNVVGTTVQYLIDSVVVHTSAAPRNAIAFPTAVLYLAGDNVDNASVTEAIASPADAYGEFAPMVASGVMPVAVLTPPFTAYGRFKALTSTAEGGATASASASFEAMASSGSMGLTVLSFTAAGRMQPMTSDAGGSSPITATGIFEPMVATGLMPGAPLLSFTAAGHFEPMTSDAEGRTLEGAAGIFEAMTSIGADRPVAMARASLQAMTGAAEMGTPAVKFAAAAGTFAPLTSFALLGALGSVFYDPLTSLGDAGAAWTPGEWDGTTVYIVSGPGADQSATVVGNNASVLWLDTTGPWDLVPPAGSDYEIRDALGNVLYRGTVAAATGPQTLRPMVGLASEGAYAESRVVLQPMRGEAFQFLNLSGTAELTLSDPFSLWAWARQVKPDTFAGVMPRPHLVGYTGAVARIKSMAAELWIEGAVDVVGTARLKAPRPTLVASGTLLDRGQGQLRAPSSTVRAYSGAVAALNMRAPQLLATSSMVTIGRAEIQAPSAGLIGFSGAVASIKAPGAQLQASGTIMDRGQATLRAPRAVVAAFSGAVAALAAPLPTLDAAGTTAILGRAALTLKQAHTMRAFSGAVLTQRLPSPTMQSQGALGAIGRANLFMPEPVVLASGETPIYGRATLTMPAPYLTTGLNVAQLVAPSLQLTALAQALDLALREAWAVNLDAAGEGAVFAATHYTGFPITQIVEFAGAAYGITATGLYLLQGDTDEDAPIAWALKTTPTDYGAIHTKRAIAAYLGGNLGPEALISVYVGQYSTQVYTYPNVRGPRLQNHRIQFGRGMASRHYAYGVSDAGGGQLELQSLDVEIVPLQGAV